MVRSTQSERVRPEKGRPIEIQIMGTGFLDVLHARDISSSGVGIFVFHGFAGCNLYDDVELVLTLPKQRPFLARGLIRHQTEAGSDSPFFGVEFTEMNDKYRHMINIYVNERISAGGAIQRNQKDRSQNG